MDIITYVHLIAINFFFFIEIELLAEPVFNKGK